MNSKVRLKVVLTYQGNLTCFKEESTLGLGSKSFSLNKPIAWSDPMVVLAKHWLFGLNILEFDLELGPKLA